MSSITKVLFYPLKKRFGRRPRAMVNDCPPPTEEERKCKFGSYCVKATVEATDENGDIDRTFVGYSQDMNITNKTQVACEKKKGRRKKLGKGCSIHKGC